MYNQIIRTFVMQCVTYTIHLLACASGKSIWLVYKPVAEVVS